MSSGSPVRVTVYTTGFACVQCKMTEQVMDAEGIPHTVIDLTDDTNDAAREYVTEDLGYTQAPVVVVDDQDHWAGFQPARIMALAARLGEHSPSAYSEGPALSDRRSHASAATYSSQPWQTTASGLSL